jgi:hypothetical protein
MLERRIKMISASEARHISKNNENFRKILEGADAEIRKSADCGNYYVLYSLETPMDERLYRELAPCFYKLGYKVAWVPYGNRLLIKWEEE